MSFHIHFIYVLNAFFISFSSLTLSFSRIFAFVKLFLLSTQIMFAWIWILRYRITQTKRFFVRFFSICSLIFSLSRCFDVAACIWPIDSRDVKQNGRNTQRRCNFNWLSGWFTRNKYANAYGLLSTSRSASLFKQTQISFFYDSSLPI